MSLNTASHVAAQHQAGTESRAGCKRRTLMGRKNHKLKNQSWVYLVGAFTMLIAFGIAIA
jgi:hypothetical protein